MSGQPVAVMVGEVLWDVFPDSLSLGGAPLNLAVHAQRLGLYPVLISAIGEDSLGDRARFRIVEMGLDSGMLRRSAKWATGTASVSIDSFGQPLFQIVRPAAYDDLRLTPADLRALRISDPVWLCFGTLFASTPEGKATLDTLFEALPGVLRFYDVNLRPGFDSLQLVADLLPLANVVKVNETEARTVGAFLGLPRDLEAFCRTASELFRWMAVCVTLGEDGCAMLVGSDFVRFPGEKVMVADTVGAGDAFAAAFLYGLTNGWSAGRIAPFANRVGALVASRVGAIPEWNIAEMP